MLLPCYAAWLNYAGCCVIFLRKTCGFLYCLDALIHWWCWYCSTVLYCFKSLIGLLVFWIYYSGAYHRLVLGVNLILIPLDVQVFGLVHGHLRLLMVLIFLHGQILLFLISLISLTACIVVMLFGQSSLLNIPQPASTPSWHRFDLMLQLLQQPMFAQTLAQRFLYLLHPILRARHLFLLP